MFKKILCSVLLSAVSCFAQTGGAPGGGGTSSSTVAILPGTPNAVYSFVAGADQSCTASGTLQDISGLGNNATLGTTPPGCTGTGYDFSVSTNATVKLPVAASTDNTFCAAVLQPTFTGPTAPSTSAGSILLFGSNTGVGTLGWSATSSVAGLSQLWQQYTATFAGGVQSQAINSLDAGFHVLCTVLGTNPTKDRIFYDGVEVAGYSQTGSSGGIQSAVTPLYLGGSGPAGASLLTFYYFAAWPASLTSTQILNASNAIKETLTLRGVAVAPQTLTLGKNFLLTTGDSITVGFGATTPWPSLLSVNSAYGTAVNEGIDGYTALAMAGQARWRDAPTCYTGSQRGLVIFAGGTNDPVFGFSAVSTMANIAAYVNYMKTAGCQVGVGTILDRTGADTLKNTLNPLIRSNAPVLGYFLVDMASLPQGGADGASANGTYFQGDGIHPTNALLALMAGVVSNAINANGIGSASSANPTVYSSNAVTMLSADVYSTIIPTTAATATLPECLGVTGIQYQIFNASAGANTITFSGKASEAITGSATLAQNATAKFQATLISQTAAGCGWQRVQ